MLALDGGEGERFPSTSAPESTRPSRSWREILIEAVGADVEPQFNPRDVLVCRRAADIARAKEVLGLEAEIAVRDGYDRRSIRSRVG